ncbi:ribose-5-phosphate isomerase RpiA [Robiginitomaculum antarcticum]|uniref:ribose-5-phosphate isomerase RpiA n=1 Tax=Robiginitomaculum antarcticum TaxID=437507 RepID=UPI000378695F|nr:ribose-5-phosphate isomerase RpiA [Robiginitomaculum antarcticum]
MSQAKQNAAHAALELVEDGMTLGLGSGSTAELFIALLGKQIRQGMSLRGVPTSEATADCARQHNVPLIEPDKVDRIHLTVDGADEVDPEFNLIKGGGACLLREKIIAHASDRMAVIVDASKMKKNLGAFPLPVEVDPFGMALTAEKILLALQESKCRGTDTTLRQNKAGTGPLITDGGHYILDCKCELIPDPAQTAQLLSQIPGVMEHGLFIGLAAYVIVGAPDHAKIMEIKAA